MSFDAFETRLQFLQLVRKLNASAQSIQKVVGYAVKYGSRCGEDLWECVMDECAKGTLNTRINILYFLDSLLEVSQSLGPPDAPYQSYISRDLPTLVNNVVPHTREGVLNLRSARLILDSWRMRRVLEGGVVEGVIAELDRRAESGSNGVESEGESSKRSHSQAFSRNDILRRMEEDRERHKRLRERIWILPIPPLISKQSAIPAPSSNNGTSANPTPSPSSPFTPASPSTRPPASSLSAAVSAGGGGGAGRKMLPPPPPLPKVAAPSSLDALEMEFEQTWESAGTLGDDDLKRMRDDARAAGLTA